ncbi:MAG: glycosyltransferase family 2 protein [Acidobacteriota bacterium]
MKVAALIPAYDEAPRIGAVIAGLLPIVARVLVVDDGSQDGTADVALAAGAEVITQARNSGKGLAIRAGVDRLLTTDATHILLLDGDGQHDPQDAPALLAVANREANGLVIGERSFDREQMPRSRYYTNIISSWVISRVFIGQSVRDAQSGYRVISTDWLRRLRLTGRGYEIETEMLIKVARRGGRIVSVPVAMRYHGAPSKLRPIRDTTRTCFLAVRYRFFPERWQ